MQEDEAILYATTVGYVAFKDEASLQQHLETLKLWDGLSVVYKDRIKTLCKLGTLGDVARIPNAMLVLISYDSLIAAKL